MVWKVGTSHAFWLMALALDFDFFLVNFGLRLIKARCV